MAGRILSAAEVFEKIPQQEPFRFVDAIEEISDDHAIGHYRWREDADFYRGHFPGNPVTPGVLLVESMAQCGVVALAIYHFYKQFEDSEAAKFQTLFTDTAVDFSGMVRPGDRVRTVSRLTVNRRLRLRAECEMRLDDGTLVCSGQLAGLGVKP